MPAGIQVVVRVAVVGLLSTLAGCASQPPAPQPREGYAADGAVSAEIVETDNADARYQPVAGSSYLDPLPLRDNAKPE